MSKTSIDTVRVEFGDCDPAGIVFFPNCSHWLGQGRHAGSDGQATQR
jgi:4-hydroxybenzoyl-CoA thioesterase